VTAGEEAPALVTASVGRCELLSPQLDDPGSTAKHEPQLRYDRVCSNAGQEILKHIDVDSAVEEHQPRSAQVSARTTGHSPALLSEVACWKLSLMMKVNAIGVRC
jgi:hypothetical protein